MPKKKEIMALRKPKARRTTGKVRGTSGPSAKKTFTAPTRGTGGRQGTPPTVSRMLPSRKRRAK